MKLPGTSWGKWWVLALLALSPLPATAQLAEPATGGNGFKVGNGRLHPYFTLETRLDSGVGYFPPSGQTGPSTLSPDLSGELAMHFRPGFKLEIPSSKLAFNLSGELNYVLYTGLLTRGSGAASHLEGAADLLARVNPEAPLSLELSDQFVRSDRTRTVAIGAGVLSLFNEARVRAPWKPGGGAIEVTPNVAYTVELFSPLGSLSPVDCQDGVCDPTTADRFDYGNLHAGVEGRWRFLPKTALVADAGVDSRGYFNDDTSPSALLVKAMAGVAGLVSPKVAVTAKAGWSQNLGDLGGGSLVAQLEANYLFGPNLSLRGGYLRMLEPVAAYGLFRDNRFYADAKANFSSKLTVHGTVALDLLSFNGGRDDTVVTLDAGPEYRLRPWLTLSAGYMLGTRSSSVEGGGVNYTRHEGYGRVSVTY